MKFPQIKMPTNSLFLIIFLVVIVGLSSILPPFFINVEGFYSIPYSTYDGAKPIDTYVSNLLTQTKETQCQQFAGKKLNDVNGLFCNSTYTGGIDQFYGLSSSPTCQGSGLTKSNGNLCLDDKTYNLLTTRGGNLSNTYSTSGTKDSQIG